MATQRMTLVMESHDPLSGVWEQAQGAGYRDSGFRVQDWGLVGLVWGYRASGADSGFKRL